MSSVETKSPAETLRRLRKNLFEQTTRKVQFEKIVDSYFIAELPCDYDGTGKETYIKVDWVSSVAQNGEQIKRIAAKQIVKGLTCKNMHMFVRKSHLEQPQKCYLCAKIIECSQNQAVADDESVSEEESKDFYTCEQECAFCCLDCQRVDDFNRAIKNTEGQTHLELDGDNWDDGQERYPSETEIFFGPRSLISILQRKTDYQSIVLKETEIPFWLSAYMYFSHSRDALYAKLSNDRGNVMIVVYLRDLAWRIFRWPDAIEGQEWHDKHSVSLICNNRVLAYYDKNSRDKMTDLVGTFKLFDLHTQTEILAVRNVFNMFFDSPSLVEPLCKIEKQKDQSDVTYEVQTASLLKDCIDKLKNVMDTGLHENRVPLDLGFTIRAQEEGTGEQKGIGASSWVVWNGKHNDESSKKLEMHMLTTTDSWEDCFKWLKDKTKEVSNRFFKHAYSQSSWNSSEKVLAVWYWREKKQKDTDIQLDLIETKTCDDTIKNVKSHCHEKLKGRRIIDVKISFAKESVQPIVSVVSLPDQNCNGVFELNFQDIDGDAELMLQLIRKQIKRSIQFVGTSFCPSNLRERTLKRIIFAEFHPFSANTKKSGQLEHLSDEATPVNFDHHKKIILVRPRFNEASRASKSDLAQQPSEMPVSESYQLCFYEFNSLKELTGEPKFDNEIKEWKLNEQTQEKHNEPAELPVIDNQVFHLQANAALDRVLLVHKGKGIVKGMSRRKEDERHIFEYFAFPNYSAFYPITNGWDFLSNNPVVLMTGSSGQRVLIRMFDGPTFYPSDLRIYSTLDHDSDKLFAIVGHNEGFSIVSLPELKAGQVDKKVGNEAQQAFTLLALELKHNQHIEFPCALSTFANGFTLTSFVKTHLQIQVKFQQEFFEFVRYQHSDQIDGSASYASSLIAYLTRDNRTSCRQCLQAQDLREIKAQSRSHEKQPDSEDKQAQACSGKMRLHVLAFDSYADKPSYKLRTIYDFCHAKVKPPCKASSKIKSVTAFGKMMQLCFQYEDSLVFVDCSKDIKVRCYPIADERGSESSTQNVGSAGREGKKARPSEKVKVMEVLPIPVVLGTDKNPYFIVKEGEMSTITKIKRGVNWGLNWSDKDKPVFQDVFSINSDKVYFFTRQSVQVGGAASNQKDEFLLMDGSHKIKVLYQQGDKLVQFKTIELFTNDLRQIDEKPFSTVSVSQGVLHYGSKVFRLLNTTNSRHEATWACYDLRASIGGDELVYVSGTENICLVKKTYENQESYLIPHADASYLDCLPVPKNGKSQSNFCTFIKSNGDFIVEQMVEESQRRFLLFKKNGQLLGTVGFKPFKIIMNAQDDQTEEINPEASKANLKMTSLELVTCSQSKNYFVFKNDKEYLVFELVSESTLQQRKENAAREKEERQRNQPGLINTEKQSRKPSCFSSKLYPAEEIVSKPKSQLGDKDQKDSQQPAQTAKEKRDDNHDSLWFQQLEFQSPDPFGPPLKDENVTILDDEKPQLIRVQIVEDKVEDGKHEDQTALLHTNCSSLSLRRCILVCLNPEQMRNFLEVSQALAQGNQVDYEGDTLITAHRDHLNLIPEIPEEQSKSFIQDTHAPARMLQWWRNKQQTEDTQTIEFKFKTKSILPNDRIITRERAKPDFMSQCGHYLIVRKGSKILVFMPPHEYDPDPGVINQAVKLKLELKGDSKLFAVYPTDMKGIVQFHLQLKDMPAGVISWDVVNDEQFNQFEAFDKSDENQKHRVLKTVIEYKETKVFEELQEYTPRVKQEQDLDQGKQCGCYLDGEALVELQHNKPVQFFNKNRQMSMSPHHEQDQTNLQNEARVSPSYEYFLSFRQPGRLHYFINDFDLVYWQRYLEYDTHELKQVEGTIARLSPFRLFNDKTPVLHKFFEEELASEKLCEDQRTVFKLFLAALQAKFDSKKFVTRNVQLASVFTRYSAANTSPLRSAYEKNRQHEFQLMIKLLSFKTDFCILTWLFNRKYTEIELRSDNILEMFYLGLKQGDEKIDSIMLPWSSSRSQLFISDSYYYGLKQDLQQFSSNPPQKGYANILIWLWRIVMKVYGFLSNALQAVERAVMNALINLVVKLANWLIRDPRFQLRTTKNGFKIGPEALKAKEEDKKQAKPEQDAKNQLPIRRVQAKFYDFQVLLGKNATQLLQILANSKDEVFEIKQVQAIVGFLWESYFDKIFDDCFMPFICQFISWHLSTLVFVYDPDELKGGFNYKYFNQLFCFYVFGKCYLSLFALELIQLRNSGLDYFSDYWNWLDIGSQATLTVHMLLHSFYEVRNSQMNVLAAFTSLLLWVKLFYWLRMFSGYGPFVRILQQIVADIRIFMIMLLLCVAGFATTTFFFNKNRDENDENSQLYLTAFNWTPANAMLGSWMTGLGEFNYDSYSNESAVSIWVVFVLATITIQLIFLNLLIAIMSESFNKIYANMERASLKETCVMILDHYWILNVSETFAKNRYVLWLKATEESEEDLNLATHDRIQDVQEMVVDMKTKLEDTQENSSNLVNMVEVNHLKIVNTQAEILQQTKTEVRETKNEVQQNKTELAHYHLQTSKSISRLDAHQQELQDKFAVFEDDLAFIKKMLDILIKK